MLILNFFVRRLNEISRFYFWIAAYQLVVLYSGAVVAGENASQLVSGNAVASVERWDIGLPNFRQLPDAFWGRLRENDSGVGVVPLSEVELLVIDTQSRRPVRVVPFANPSVMGEGGSDVDLHPTRPLVIVNGALRSFLVNLQTGQSWETVAGRFSNDGRTVYVRVRQKLYEVALEHYERLSEMGSFRLGFGQLPTQFRLITQLERNISEHYVVGTGTLVLIDSGNVLYRVRGSETHAFGLLPEGNSVCGVVTDRASTKDYRISISVYPFPFGKVGAILNLSASSGKLVSRIDTTRTMACAARKLDRLGRIVVRDSEKSELSYFDFSTGNNVATSADPFEFTISPFAGGSSLISSESVLMKQLRSTLLTKGGNSIGSRYQVAFVDAYADLVIVNDLGLFSLNLQAPEKLIPVIDAEPLGGIVGSVLSPDRETVYFVTPSNIYAYSLNQRKLIWRAEHRHYMGINSPNLAVSPKGNHLAVGVGKFIDVINSADGAVIAHIENKLSDEVQNNFSTNLIQSWRSWKNFLDIQAVEFVDEDTLIIGDTHGSVNWWRISSWHQAKQFRYLPSTPGPVGRIRNLGNGRVWLENSFGTKVENIEGLPDWERIYENIGTYSLLNIPDSNHGQVLTMDRNGNFRIVRQQDGNVEKKFQIPGVFTHADLDVGKGVGVLTTSNGTVKYFRYTDDHVKVFFSVVVGGGGQLLISIPEGWFTSDAIGLIYGASVVNAMRAWPLIQYLDVFHRPDIVRAKLRGEDIRPLIGDLTIEKALLSPPPKVEVGRVTEATDASRLKIPYTITPEAGGVAEVRIFQNGKLISSDGTYKDAPGKAYAPVGGKSAVASRYAEANLQRNAKLIEPVNGGTTSKLRDQLIVRGSPEKKCTPDKAGDPCKGEIEVDVIPGEENTITVVAFNRDNTIQSVPASISFKSNLAKEEPHLWVIGVGINNFANISKLNNAKKDAQDFVCAYAGRESVSKLGMSCNEEGKAKSLFKMQNIHNVDALFDAQATKNSILGALDKVAQQAKPGDTFVWFVASHGMMDANSNFGIVTYDTQCLNSNCTDIKGYLTSNDILEASKKIKAMKQLVVLDTCHSGGLDSKLSGLYDARVSLLAKNMGLHLYASAQATESAQDGKPGTNGTFTAQLLEGIKGAAPKNSEGQISVMTLGQYAKQKTIDVTQPKSGAKNALPAQTPVIQHFGQDAGLVGRLH